MPTLISRPAPELDRARLPGGTASRRARVLVLDGQTTQALACVRSLGRAGYDVLVASDCRWPLGAWSRHSRARCVVKARRSNVPTEMGFSRDPGPGYAASHAELDQTVQARRQGEHWPIIQSWVAGQGKGVSALCDHGRVVAWFAHERLRDVQPSGSGSSLRRSAPTEARLRAPAERLLAALEWHGPAMVEFRDDDVH